MCPLMHNSVDTVSFDELIKIGLFFLPVLTVSRKYNFYLRAVILWCGFFVSGWLGGLGLVFQKSRMVFSEKDWMQLTGVK